MELKDAQGRYKTQSLFAETLDYRVEANGYSPVFTLLERLTKPEPPKDADGVDNE